VKRKQRKANWFLSPLAYKLFPRTYYGRKKHGARKRGRKTKQLLYHCKEIRREKRNLKQEALCCPFYGPRFATGYDPVLRHINQ
jgi:hypothetical protein